MKNASKGALLSGLVLPGLGQIVMKHYIRGAVILFIVTVSATAIIVRAVQQALSILGDINIEDGMVGMDTIAQAVHGSTASGSLLSSPAWLLLILSWVIGTVDAYRVGKRKDMEEGPEDLG